MNTYKIEYTSFKGTKYANSGNNVTLDARDITSAISKVKKLLGITESAINQITKI